MSRRTGQNGTIEVRNGAYRGRWLEDVPGVHERVKRSVVLGLTREMTKSEARRKLRGVISATGMDSPSYRIPSGDSFAARVERWEQNYLVRMKPSNQSNMRYHLNAYLLPKWGTTPVDLITADKVNEWLGSDELRHLATATVRGIVTTLQLVLGVRFGTGKIHYRSTVEEEADARCFSSEEVAAIVAAATGQYKALFALAAETGMRAGELYGLQVEDIDFARNVVHVRRSTWKGKLQSPKTRNARRAVDVQPYVTEMLREHLAGRQSGLVFLSTRNTLLQNATVLDSHLQPLLKQLGFAQGGMHAFRHFRVSFLVQNETPVEVIKRWLGHGSEQMIRHYTHLHPTYYKSVMARIPVAVLTQIDPFTPISTRGNVVQIA